MKKIIHILPHNIEDFISTGYTDFDHHSVRFIERVKKFLPADEEIVQELWVLSKKASKVEMVVHQSGFIVRLFPLSIRLPLPLEFSWSLLNAVLRTKEPSVVWHLHSYYLIMNDILAIVLGFRRQKFVVHHRGGGPSWTPKAFLYTVYHYTIGFRITFSLARCVFVQNKTEEQRLRKLRLVKAKKVIYFPNTVSRTFIDQMRERVSRTVKKRQIVIAGRMIKVIRNKEILAFIEKILDHKEWSLSIIGCKEKEKDELVRSIDITRKNFSIHGWMMPEMMYQEFAGATYFFHPNTKENFEGSPMTLIEAAACGLPGLVFDISGVRDVVRDRENGFVFENIDEAKHRILEILSHTTESAEVLGNNAQRIIDENFTDEYYFPLLIRVYTSLFAEIK